MQISAFQPPARLLMGPGPSNVASSVLKAMSLPVLGHLDPVYLGLMDGIRDMLREVFRTKNEMTFSVSGTGSAGMELCLVNLIEPGDEVVVCVNGFFGLRLVEIAERCGARVTKVEAEWGKIVEADKVEAALKHLRPKVVALVHAETSTGVLNPVEEISRLAHVAGALFVLDTVTSLGACPVKIDDWQVDAVYSCTQKGLSAPPGLSPVSLSARAMEVAARRQRKVQSWYLDAPLLAKYWGGERVYHHTAPCSMNYALHEALRLVLEEGLEARWRRHEENHRALKAGLEAMGLKIASQPGHQLWQLNTVTVPEGIDELAVRKQLLNDYNIELGAGLGPLKGKIWRVGLMGENSRPEVVKLFLGAFRHVLGDAGYAPARR